MQKIIRDFCLNIYFYGNNFMPNSRIGTDVYYYNLEPQGFNINTLKIIIKKIYLDKFIDNHIDIFGQI